METLKLESFQRSWKEPSEVGKNRAKLESFAAIGKCRSNFPNSARTFQLQLELSNFSANFSTSAGTFELQSFQFHFGISILEISNFSFFPTALSNYMYPVFSMWTLIWCPLYIFFRNKPIVTVTPKQKTIDVYSNNKLCNVYTNNVYK